MRFTALAFALSLGTAVAHAQQQRPLQLEPLPEPPPAAVGFDNGPDAAGVTIRPPEGRVEEELRPDGQRVVRVVTPEGIEYEIDQYQGDTSFAVPFSGDDRVRAPRWVILRW
jgi:hypothetical protein